MRSVARPRAAGQKTVIAIELFFSLLWVRSGRMSKLITTSQTSSVHTNNRFRV